MIQIAWYLKWGLDMQCPQCQFENVDEAKFCNECGSKIEVSCAKCGKPNPPGSKFCNECGYDLKTSKKALDEF